jgi:hypothetical protein
MNYELQFDVKTARLVRLAIKHEIERLDFRRESVDEDSDECIDLANDAECLQIVYEKIDSLLKAGLPAVV